MKLKVPALKAVLVLALGLTPVFAFQNCSSSLPSLDQASTAAPAGAADSVLQPRAASVAPGATIQFQSSTIAVPTVGTFALVSGGGSIDSATGIYTAPSTATDAVVKARDSSGNISYSFIKVGTSQPLVLVPSSVSIGSGATIAFAAAGGVGPYTYSSVVSPLASISANGVFTTAAGITTSGSTVVTVTDSLGNTATALVQINAALQATLSSFFSPNPVLPGGSSSFYVNGNSAPMALELVSGAAGTTDGQLFTAGGNYGVSNFTASDQYGRSLSATLSICAHGLQNCVTSLGGPTKAIQLASDHLDNCVVKSDQSVWCWGYNSRGQLGNNTTTESSVPVNVHKSDGTLLYANKVVIDGFYATCAIQAIDSTVWCWGANGYGQIGNGNTTDQYEATAVHGLGAVQDLGAGFHSFCAVDMNGEVWCWGDNAAGQLGNNSTSNSSLPLNVVTSSGTALSGVNHVAGSSDQSFCAYSTSHLNTGIYCWGYNGYGQLGTGSTTASHVAAPVISSQMSTDGVTDIISMSKGGDSNSANGLSCAEAKTSGGLYRNYCWGLNSYGQLLDGTQTNRNVPVQASLIPDQSSPYPVVINAYSSCYVVANAMKCLGYNGYGELGNATTTNSTGAFVQVLGIGGTGTLSVSAVATSAGSDSGYESYCAITTAGTVACWGYGGNGNLRNGATSTSYTPVGVFQ